jgi:hypothetical protein
MTGINLNVQNSYAALYTTSQTQTQTQTAQSTTTSATSDTTTIRRGEQLTLSAEAIALSQQTFKPAAPTEETTLGSGGGIRPPEVSTGS